MPAKRSKRSEKPLTIEQANEMATGYAEVSPDTIDPTLWLIEGDGWTETREPMGRAAFARLLADKCAIVVDDSDKDIKRCPTRHDGHGVHQRVQDADAGTYCCLFCNVVYRLPKTYAATMPDGRTVHCTVPEDPTPDEVLFDAIKDNFSPQAVAAMAAYLQAANTKNREVNRQLAWFAAELVKMLGATGYGRLLGEVGL